MEGRRTIVYDVIIIGGGVSGASVARELSRCRVRLCVLEKEADICCGTSKANSAIVHAGYDAPEGSLKARLNVRGNKRMEALAKELDFPFKRNGSLVLCLSEEDMPGLRKLFERGRANGVDGLRILSKEETLALEPNVAKQVYASLYAPTAGIVCPFGLNIALAENACVNGAEFKLSTKVEAVRRLEEGYELQTSQGVFRTRCVVNAAGVYADRIHNMVSEKKMYITPRRGEYILLDKTAGTHVRSTIFSLPGRLGKGVLVTPTIHGNLLLGPTATDIEDREGTNTTREGLAQVIEKAGMNVENIPLKQVITSFAGLRAHADGDDFIIGEAEDAKGFFDCAGIESPGLASCPAVGEMVAQMIKDKLGLESKPDFISERKGIVSLQALSREEQVTLIRKNPAYGNIICRCEMVSEGEIVDAIHRPLGATTLDGIKRRTRAGMGRCQSGFCSPKVMELLVRESAKSMAEITKSGGGSNLVYEADAEDAGGGYGEV